MNDFCKFCIIEWKLCISWGQFEANCSKRRKSESKEEETEAFKESIILWENFDIRFILMFFFLILNYIQHASIALFINL
jgi:hypothetical protein